MIKIKIFFLLLIESALTGKLVGGRDLLHKEAKYLVYIMYKGVHKFTGCLISKRHVLTAAHNLYDFWVKPIIPFFGDYHVVVGSFNETQTGIKMLMEQVQAYKHYIPDDNTSTNNIAVITVDIIFLRKELRKNCLT